MMTTLSLSTEKHIKYILNLDKKQNDLEYWLSAHLRLNGIYWGTTALAILDKSQINAMEQKKEIVDRVMGCKASGTGTCKDGGFGGHPDHDPHLLFTLSAVQVLATFNCLDDYEWSDTIEYVVALQQKDGSFAGDEWGEVDTRFVYCAVSCLSLLGALDRIDCDATIRYIQSCRNFDGGFGSCPGAESHAGQIFCCVGALSILDALHFVDSDQLGWWLAERQLPNGGLNGRPEKLEDVCYSWWVLASLAMLDRVHWIHQDKLIQFILSAQDEEDGGIADRPGDMPDVFHTVFGICGLSLLGYPNLEPVDPRYCMPKAIIDGLLNKPPLKNH